MLTNPANCDIIIVGVNAGMTTSEKKQEYGVRYGKDSVNADIEYLFSDAFAKKFEHITDAPDVDQALLECARAAVKHRTGTLYEDMYLINGNTGEVIARQLNAAKEQRINYTAEMFAAIRSANSGNIPIIALHSHPEGYPPSIDDFNSLYEHDYSLGIVVGHNGQVYKYKSDGSYVENPDEIQLNIMIACNGGVDIDRAYSEALGMYGLSYIIVKE